MMAWQSRRSFTTWGLKGGEGREEGGERERGGRGRERGGRGRERGGRGRERGGRGKGGREGDKDLLATSTLLHVHWRASLQGDHLRLVGLQNKLVWDDLKQRLLQVWRPPLGALCERTKK